MDRDADTHASFFDGPSLAASPTPSAILSTALLGGVQSASAYCKHVFFRGGCTHMYKQEMYSTKLKFED